MIQFARMARAGAVVPASAILRESTRNRTSAWTVVPLVFFASRGLAVVCHYLVPTPYGEPLIRLGARALFDSLRFSIVATLILLVAFRLLGHLMGRLFGLRGERWAAWIYAACASVYIVVGEIDLELMRLVGQHFRISALRHFLNRDGSTLPSFASDPVGAAVAAFLCIVPVALVFLLTARQTSRAPLRRTTTGLLAIPALLGVDLTLNALRSPAGFDSIQPPLVTFLQRLRRQYGQSLPEQDFDLGVELLHQSLKRSRADYPLPWYPLWRAVPNEEQRFAAFRARPLEEKRDVLFVLMESPQGWEFDLRSPGTCKRFPSLCALFRERGVFFPRCHSVGFPSQEGSVGVHLGLWSHPTEHILNRYKDVRTVSLPQIAARAGYATRALAAGNPTVYDLQSWYGKWYEKWEYRAERSDDLSAALRIIDIEEELPADRPHFVHFGTTTMHAPWDYPGSLPERGRSFHQRYIDSAEYADFALGRLFKALSRSPRWQRTVVVVVGDHSITGPWLGFQRPRAGSPNAAETWIPLLIAAPGFRGGEVREEPVSQLDVPPTLLGLLGIQASNHFIGRDLFDAKEPAPIGVFSFRRRGLAFTRDTVRYQFDLYDSTFMLKRRYTDYDPACADPEGYGCYRNGSALPAEPEDAELRERVKLLARSYAELFERDQIAPPYTSSVYR